jgi:glucose/arabinose dehydrogenase
LPLLRSHFSTTTVVVGRAVKAQEPLTTGLLQDNNYIGRPVDVQPMKDGSLLMSDD